MTKWTYDEVPGAGTSEMAAIYITDLPEGGSLRTLDLMGAHVFIDVDDAGNVISVEILGPAVFVRLKDLEGYLKEPPSILGGNNEPVTGSLPCGGDCR
jgi:uncharacterized protein YuzE